MRRTTTKPTPNFFVIGTREPTAHRVPVSLAKENEEQVFDLDSVKWETPEQFQMRVAINCNPYTTPDTCTDDTRKKVLRTYRLVINARSLEVSSTLQAVESSSMAGLPDSQAVARPSFDCSKAKMPTESLICRDPELAILEREMASAYKELLDQTPSSRKASVIKKQREWLTQYVRSCDAARSDTDRKSCAVTFLRDHSQDLRTREPGDTGGAIPHIGAFKVGNGVSAPVVLSKTEPVYSEQARSAKLQGSVQLNLVVDENGLPQQITVARPLGMGLDEKAIEAVRRWRFRPGMKDGHPVAVEATIAVNFRLL